jgi:serine/threonine-protein kinase
MAPELSRGALADARSDLYALGCVLYELLTGRPPFSGELPATILSQHISSTPRPLERLNLAVPPALGALVMKLLSKEPDQRPQDAHSLVTALPATMSSRSEVTLDGGTAPTLLLVEPLGAGPAPTMVMGCRALGPTPGADGLWERWRWWSRSPSR